MKKINFSNLIKESFHLLIKCIKEGFYLFIKNFSKLTLPFFPAVFELTMGGLLLFSSKLFDVLKIYSDYRLSALFTAWGAVLVIIGGYKYFLLNCASPVVSKKLILENEAPDYKNAVEEIKNSPKISFIFIMWVWFIILGAVFPVLFYFLFGLLYGKTHNFMNLNEFFFLAYPMYSLFFNLYKILAVFSKDLSNINKEMEEMPIHQILSLPLLSLFFSGIFLLLIYLINKTCPVGFIIFVFLLLIKTPIEQTALTCWYLKGQKEKS